MAVCLSANEIFCCTYAWLHLDSCTIMFCSEEDAMLNHPGLVWASACLLQTGTFSVLRSLTSSVRSLWIVDFLYFLFRELSICWRSSAAPGTRQLATYLYFYPTFVPFVFDWRHSTLVDSTFCSRKWFKFTTLLMPGTPDIWIKNGICFGKILIFDG